MEKELQKQILSDNQIKKFTYYGFLKNLKFFEPYLIIYLMSNDLSLFEIGLLISIKEIIVNVFEIPSGLVADYFGRKKELCSCFVFYIISFIVFFLSHNFAIAAIAMTFFGLGEAFRSGTHKAMIYTYLESKGWEGYKTFVYGKTRSGSLTGSAISSVLGIFIILKIPSSSYIFLVSIIPYILDFALILSYPDYLDKGTNEKTTFKNMLISFKDSLVKNRGLRLLLLNEAVFEATVASIKDFIQPILQTIIIGSGVLLIASMDADSNLKIIIGLVYAVINVLSAIATRKAYILKNKNGNMPMLNILYYVLVASLVLLGIFTHMPYLVILIFVIINLLFNIRKPIFVDEIDNHMAKKERATILSVSSQLKSLIKVVMAPLIGFIADAFGMNMVMYTLSFILIISFGYFVLRNGGKTTLEV